MFFNPCYEKPSWKLIIFIVNVNLTADGLFNLAFSQNSSLNFIAGLTVTDSTGLRNLYDNLPSSVRDISGGRGFRVFLNSSFGRFYFNSNNKEEYGNAVRKISNLKKHVLFVTS